MARLLPIFYAGAVITGIVIAVVFILGSVPHASLILPLLGIFLIIEMVVLRKILVPRFADYGRFRITENRIELFPLSATGLSVLPTPNSFLPGEFDGVTITPRVNAGPYCVILVHKHRAKTLPARMFTHEADARDFSIALADALGLRVIV